FFQAQICFEFWTARLFLHFLIEFKQPKNNRAILNLKTLKITTINPANQLLKFLYIKDYAKYINSDLYKLQKHLRDIENFDGFFEKIVTLDQLNQDTLRIELLGSSNLSPRVNKKLTSQLLAMLKEFREIQNLGLKENINLPSALKVQMKYDFLNYAVSEYGYKNEKLEEISNRRKFSILSIFIKDNKNLLSAEAINEIYNEFVNDKELGRFNGPLEETAFGEFIKENVESLKFENSKLYLYQNHIKNINLDDVYRALEGFSKYKQLSGEFKNDLAKKLGPETDEFSNKILNIAGYEYNPEKISLSARGIYSEVKAQHETSKNRPFDIGKNPFDVEFFKPTLEFFVNLKNLVVEISSVQESAYKTKIRLSNQKSCPQILDTSSSIESIFMKLRENKIFIDFLAELKLD
ncbi:MAG: hypothetical protein AB8G05_10610, partial [Oligoflexales bacterium]